MDQAQLATDIRSIKSAVAELRKVTVKVLERTAVLETDKQSTERERVRFDASLSKLFDLHRNLSEDITSIKVSLASLKTETGANTKTGDRWLTMFLSISGSIVAGVAVAKVFV